METKKKRKTINEELNEFVDSIQVSNAEEENKKDSEETKKKDVYYILPIFTPQQIIDWVYSMEDFQYYFEKDKYTNEIEITIIGKIF